MVSKVKMETYLLAVLKEGGRHVDVRLAEIARLEVPVVESKAALLLGRLLAVAAGALAVGLGVRGEIVRFAL